MRNRLKLIPLLGSAAGDHPAPENNDMLSFSNY